MRHSCLIACLFALVSAQAVQAQGYPPEGMEPRGFPPPAPYDQLYKRDHLRAPPPALHCEIIYASPAGPRREYCPITARLIDSVCSCDPPPAPRGSPPSARTNGHAVP